MPPFILSLLATAWLTTGALVWAAPAWLVFALLERFGPVHGGRPSCGAQVKGAVFQILGTAVGAVPVFMFWHWIPVRPHPLFPALAFPLALLIGDFFHYWEHRFEHRFAWRFHAVHHAAQDLAGTSNFNHFTHGLMMQVVYGVPVSLLCRDMLAIPAMSFVLYAFGTFVHSPTKLSIGPLWRVVCDNRFHRLHHSAEPRHHERNFGTFFPIWDMVFGTAYWPMKGEWPETGIVEYGEIQTMRDFLLIPFCTRRRSEMDPQDVVVTGRAN
jgi:sterol desaturase/sphingolipid hydroxylase (fatty acid hydroxylase superfamily)